MNSSSTPFYNIELKHIDKLDIENSISLEDRKFLASFYGSGFANMIILWLRDPNQEDKQIIIARAKKYLSDYIEQAILKGRNHE